MTDPVCPDCKQPQPVGHTCPDRGRHEALLRAAVETQRILLRLNRKSA